MPNLTNYVWLMVFTPIFAVVLIGLLGMVLFMDPGTVKESVINVETGRPKTLYDIVTAVPPGKQNEYCIDCEIACPAWTKHCKLCDHCYKDMDHHCLFLLKCIAENNHVYFVWFIMACVVSMVTFVLSVRCYCQLLYSLALGETLLLLFHTDGWLFSLTILNSISVFWGVQLLYFQLNIISKGYTTYFQPRDNIDILTASEKFMNVLCFLLKRKSYIENPMLKQEQQLYYNV
ncbi:palmitoyltransferase ERF2-like [Gigantopelta aegis]|uniref:palmitoyltransferase ERF2-like n=1 Tax=Gigantopelta aegis TaxID=1735272 RepID=UPI001B88AF74|nr:palmitoyltransferase ERF2-like [Gigantopelta aegis]